MPRFRKRPVEIEAIQYKPETLRECMEFCGAVHSVPDATLVIVTLEGSMRASVGDWIIKGVSGEFYPCKPDIFEATYELVDAAEKTPI